jgi:hypothetical protein
MSFLIYLFVLIVGTASVLFGLDLMTAPLGNTPNVPIGRTVQITSQPPAKQRQIIQAGEHALTPIYSTGLGAPKVQSQMSAVVSREQPKAVSADSSRIVLHANDKPEAETIPSALGKERGAQQRPRQTAPLPSSYNNSASQIVTDADLRGSPASCNAQECGAAYHSFRASDCTYQSVSGTRRACAVTKGLVARDTGPRSMQGAQRTAMHQSLDVAPAQPTNDVMSETERIVRRMTANNGENITVQDGAGRIFIVRKSDR